VFEVSFSLSICEAEATRLQRCIKEITHVTGPIVTAVPAISIIQAGFFGKFGFGIVSAPAFHHVNIQGWV
jgi:stage V sporulation protein SpoVS